jgi:hypothetical protein
MCWEHTNALTWSMDMQWHIKVQHRAEQNSAPYPTVARHCQAHVWHMEESRHQPVHVPLDKTKEHMQDRLHWPACCWLRKCPMSICSGSTANCWRARYLDQVNLGEKMVLEGVLQGLILAGSFWMWRTQLGIHLSVLDIVTTAALLWSSSLKAMC